ncbi:MAG: hypothetical protein A3F69_01015 [Acidobacteria bacterium RIFCSPLOWO2_12_FULL_66_10]|nr:MAG: hypothetical protein A3F69_01015 [Acidobacteria bacterium RIFCSPLOWO2_12_FULL_66_10]
MTSAQQHSRARRLYVDWARAIAVLLMIEAHTLDAWTRPADRQGVWFRDASVLGGFAAPLFLWLAGLAVVLSATRAAERTGSRMQAVLGVARRGLEIFILAFLFRLQAFIVSPGSHPLALFRVDILNVMGPALVVAGLVWGCAVTARGRATAFALLAATTAMVTPIVRAAAFVDHLPLWVRWYVRPFGDYTTFVLLPCASFVFAGGAVGVLIAAAGDEGSERRLQAILSATGAALVALGFYTASRPSIYHASSFWTSSPTWFAIRVGILMVALSAIYAIERAFGRGNTKTRNSDRPFRACLALWQGPLSAMGRSSLFIYWIHVELVYGYASWFWRYRLPLWGTAIAWAVFCVLMYRAIGLRDRLVDAWRRRQRGAGSTPQTTTA